MLLHRAELCMAAVHATLTGLETTGANAFRARQRPLAQNEIPALRLRMGAERIVAILSQSLVDCDLDLSVEAVLQRPGDASAGNDELEQQLNQIRAEITRALFADYTQGLGFVLDTIEGDTDAPTFSAEGAQPVALQMFHWTIRYRRNRFNPGA